MNVTLKMAFVQWDFMYTGQCLTSVLFPNRCSCSIISIVTVFIGYSNYIFSVYLLGIVKIHLS